MAGIIVRQGELSTAGDGTRPRKPERTVVDDLEGQLLLGDAPRARNVHDLEHGAADDGEGVRQDGGRNDARDGAAGHGADGRERGVPQVLLVALRLDLVDELGATAAAVDEVSKGLGAADALLEALGAVGLLPVPLRVGQFG